MVEQLSRAPLSRPLLRVILAVHAKQRPQYERLLDTDMIGSRSRLPRGRQKLEKDPEFFRSVHLVGDGLQREREETKRRAEELWRSKVMYPALAQQPSNA